jgi:hypothetical protein
MEDFTIDFNILIDLNKREKGFLSLEDEPLTSIFQLTLREVLPVSRAPVNMVILC